MAQYYLQSITKPENRFEILSSDKAAGTMKLLSPFTGHTWSESLDFLTRENLTKHNYKIVKGEEHVDS